METYQITLTGKTPLLMHNDNLEWADFMDAWKNDPANKQLSKPGDDRTPAWRWLGCCYHDGTVLVLPQENIMKSLMEGGVMVPVPGGKGGKTFKAQTQSGMMSVEPAWRLLIGGKPIAWANIEQLKDEPIFSAHKAAAKQMGFDLLVKRATVGTQKHVRVRPIFSSGWQLVGSISVWDPQITEAALKNIFEYAGQFKGVGNWRPSAPKRPGPYGTFEATFN